MFALKFPRTLVDNLARCYEILKYLVSIHVNSYVDYNLESGHSS
jgi:hypothetical protein